MSNFNQLRQNVRNYCVGLTADEIEKELILCRDNPNTVERAKYFGEYLAELGKEQNMCKAGDLTVGELFSEKFNDSHVFMKIEVGTDHPVIFPSSGRGMIGKFYDNTFVYKVTNVDITRG